MTVQCTVVLYELCQADDYVPDSEPIGNVLTTACS